MVYLRIGQRIVDVRGYDNMRRIWMGDLILRIRIGWVVGREEVLEIKNILWNLRVV